MRHLCDLACLLAKQVLSQLSYTPTVETTLILKHFSRFQNPFPRIFITRANWAVDRTWQPNLNKGKRDEMYNLWKRAVTRSFDWAA
jgi:hypothetical protein